MKDGWLDGQELESAFRLYVASLNKVGCWQGIFYFLENGMTRSIRLPSEE